MKTHFYNRRLIHIFCCLLFCLIAINGIAQNAVVSNPMAIGKDCNRTTGENFKVFSYTPSPAALTQVGLNCLPSLALPGFTSGGGSIAFNPSDQKVYYIETTNGNNSIVWSWTPGTCPTSSQAALYTYSNTFIVGLDFNALSGDGYQIEFVGSAPPYSIYLRKVTSFGPPLVAGTPQQINLPAGVNIYQQNGDVVITPTGQMYFVFNNKMFSLDYSTYGTGTLNANYIDTLQLGTGVNMVGLSYYNGKFIGSATNNGSTCVYKEINISTTPVTLNTIPSPIGSGATRTFSTLDMASLITGIGVAKKVSSVTSAGSNNWIVRYDVKVRTYGNANLTNVQLADNMATVFGASFSGASVSAVGTLPSGLSLNASYNGSTNTNIFSGGAGSTLKVAPADSAIVRITVNLTNPNTATTYLSSAIGSGQSNFFVQAVSDSSNDDLGLRADLNNNDVPDDVAEDIPTPLRLLDWITLPDNIIDFNAKPENKNVKLVWAVQHTDDRLKINIQRSIDGSHFETINTMSIPGSNNMQPYNWLDAAPNEKDNYYRLEFVKPNGSIFYSEIVKVNLKNEKISRLHISPLPFNDQLGISFTLNRNEKITCKIRNLNSNILYSSETVGFKGDNNISLNNLGALPAGTYVLQLISEDETFNKIIVKTK